MTEILTVVAQREAITLTPAILNQIRNAVRGAPPVILSPGEAADIPLFVPDMDVLRAALDGTAIDAIGPTRRPPQRAGRRHGQHHRRPGETLDELADFAGLEAAHRRDHRARDERRTGLQGRAARARRMLRASPLDALERTWERVRLTSGARELVATMRANGALRALVSGGFTFFTSRVAAPLRLRRAPFEHRSWTTAPR